MLIPRLHIPDGFVNLPVSAFFGLLSIAFVGLALKGAAKTLDDRTTPLAGLTAVFIFAAQMINFPVAAGTSGHLVGAALATVLVGPYSATLALTVVLGVQALLFADGGLSALGLNVFNLSVIAVWVSHFAIVGLRKVLPKTKSGVTIAATVAAYISVPLAALGFTIQYAIGGTGTIPVETVGTAMIGTHLLIGIGEALITFITVSAVIATRSDLVYGWKPTLEVRS
ncbi:MAG: energy-coupling factor ABC transporter permease [Actinomycetota bacterium]